MCYITIAWNFQKGFSAYDIQVNKSYTFTELLKHKLMP